MRALRAHARGAAGRPPVSVAFGAPPRATPLSSRGSSSSRQQTRGAAAASAAAASSASAAPAAASAAALAPAPALPPPTAASSAGAASWPLLYRASRVASFSGLCYVDTSAAAGPAGVAELERRAAAMGLRLVAHGRSAAAGGTSWVVGDATIDYAAFARRAGLSAGATATTNAATAAAAASESSRMALPLAPPARRERFVLLRGVAWGAGDTDVIGLSAALAQVWPAAYPREGSELVAHAGVARLARALRAEVRAAALSGGGEDDAASAVAGDHEGGGGGGDARRGGQQQQRLPVVWAGHSLGGALAKLLWVAEVADGGGEQQRRRRQQEEQRRQHDENNRGRRRAGGPEASDDEDDGASSPLLPEVLTFGSPPVLAHAKGGGSAAMMRVLSRLASSSSPAPASAAEQKQQGPGGGFSGGSGRAAPSSILVPETAVASYVLEGDPVPRALLSADPTFASLRQNTFFSAALRLNQQLFGGGAPLTPGRFLFEPLGVVKLVRWSASGGSEVVPLSGSAEEVAKGLLAAASGVGAAAATEAAAAAVSAAAGGSGSGSGGDGATATAAPAAAGWSPLASLRAWLDHHHGSYTQELEAAAISALRAEQRAAALQRRPQQQQQQQQQQQREQQQPQQAR